MDFKMYPVWLCKDGDTCACDLMAFVIVENSQPFSLRGLLLSCLFHLLQYLRWHDRTSQGTLHAFHHSFSVFHSALSSISLILSLILICCSARSLGLRWGAPQIWHRPSGGWGGALYSWHLCVWWRGQWVNSAPSAGKTAKWMQLLLQKETGSWGEGAGLFLPAPAFQSSLSLPCWQGFTRSQLDKQERAVPSPRCGNAKQNIKGQRGLSQKLKARQLRSVVNLKMFGEFSQYLRFLV